ncbi:MAG: hypothetical protein KIT16_10815 [Rhodospirillaceae bacterium]|nr:hypothetical protein [Rhodospirillaceae bacterium]
MALWNIKHAPRKRHYVGAAGIAAGLIGGTLAIGILGYHYLNALPWIDALVDASMILAGMGPVSALKYDGAKLFASGYALFSGLIVLASFAVLATPWLHFFLHCLDRQADED